MKPGAPDVPPPAGEDDARSALEAAARAQARLAEDPESAIEDLLELSAEVPMAAAVLLEAARAAEGSARMPLWYAALERLVDIRPEDPAVLLGAGEYRALHFEEEGARRLFLAARDLAADPAIQARALCELAALAERAGREDEAIAHLRNATRLADDAEAFAHLGRLLLRRDPTDALRMLGRATVLDPSNPALLLALAKALREAGAEPARHLAVATELARLCEGRPELAEAARTELEYALAAT